MIKRTPQEIVDFFGCYVAMDRNGEWFLYTEKPVLDDELGAWDLGEEDCEITDITAFITDEPDHDWTILYEPYDSRLQNPFYALADDFITKAKKADLCPYLPVANDSGISVKSCCPDFKDSGSKDSAPHQSQVHTHQEYVVAEAKRAQDLAKKVNVMLDHGWKPQGGIAIEYLPESDGYPEGSEIFYQALTRGIA